MNMNVAGFSAMKNRESNTEYVDKEADYSTLEGTGTDTGDAHGMTRIRRGLEQNFEVYDEEIPGRNVSNY